MTDFDLRLLARFVTEFDRDDFSPGHWVGMREREDDDYTMPYSILSSAVSEFVRVADEGGWILRDFHWPDWLETEEAIALYRDRDLLAKATPYQIAKLITVSIRQDRYIEGGLLGDFQSGHILAIVRRAAKLLEDGHIPSEP